MLLQPQRRPAAAASQSGSPIAGWFDPEGVSAAGHWSGKRRKPIRLLAGLAASGGISGAGGCSGWADRSQSGSPSGDAGSCGLELQQRRLVCHLKVGQPVRQFPGGRCGSRCFSFRRSRSGRRKANRGEVQSQIPPGMEPEVSLELLPVTSVVSTNLSPRWDVTFGCFRGFFSRGRT